MYVNSSWKTQRKEDNADKEEERRLDCQLEGDRERGRDGGRRVGVQADIS